MSEQESESFKAPSGEQDADAQMSPSQKIEGEPAPGSTKPGAQKPESEVHNEVNPNTE